MGRLADKARDSAIVDADVIEGTAGAVMQLDDIDTEMRWDEWIHDLRETQGTGKITAYKLPLGPDGVPNPSAKGSKQIRLGSWPHDQFNLDEIIDIIKRDYLDAGETAGIRLSGTVAGKPGTMFNRVITIKNPRTGTSLVSVAQPPSEIAAIVREMREFMNRPLPEPPPPPLGLVASLTPMMPFIAPILTAMVTGYMARPKPKSELADLIAAMASLKDFTEGNNNGGSSDDSDDSLSSIIKAVAPQGLALLTEMAKRAPVAVPASVAQHRQNPRVVQSVSRGTAPMGTSSAVQQRPAPPHAETPSAPIHSPNEVTPDMLAQIAPQLEQLAVMAANGADPKQTAELVMTSMPEDPVADERLYKLLANETAFGALKSISPAVAANWEWFLQVRIHLLAEFEDDSAETVTG